MLREVIILAIGAIFGLGSVMSALAAPSHFPNMPPWVWYWLFWGGVALMALMVIDAAFLAFWRPRLLSAVFVNAGLFFLAAATIAQFSPAYLSKGGSSQATSAAIARLAELGWTVKPGQDDILFEIAGGSLPPMQESATYFTQLNKPFRLHFQSVKSLEGLHYLADIAGCTNIEISAGEFTDISELRGFVHLTKLAIGQVPLNGVGVVDSSPLSSLLDLQELVLGMTRIRDTDFLGSLINLKRLYLGQTLITDVSPISALHSLEYLDIRGARVTDLRPLNQNQNLTELSIGGEQIPGLANLTNLPNLKKLTLIEQQPVDLSPVGALTHLESFWAWGPPHFDIAQLHNLSKLQNLTLTGISLTLLSSVSNAQMIGDFKELKTLTLGQLQISDLSFLSKLENISEININRLPVVSIESFRGLTSLKKVTFADIPLVDISPLLDLQKLAEVTFIRVPARADVLTELERRGVSIKRY